MEHLTNWNGDNWNSWHSHHPQQMYHRCTTSSSIDVPQTPESRYIWSERMSHYHILWHCHHAIETWYKTTLHNTIYNIKHSQRILNIAFWHGWSYTVLNLQLASRCRAFFQQAQRGLVHIMALPFARSAKHDDFMTIDYWMEVNAVDLASPKHKKALLYVRDHLPKKNVFFRALPEWGGGGGPCPN